jgi:AraC family transcriptional regulator of adaptative response / DNA-3-methyladenine glycosylase II
MLRYLAVRATRGIEVADRDRYRRCVRIDGATAVAELRRGDAATLVLAVDGCGPDDGLGARARRLFDLDADPGALQVGRDDPVLAPLVVARPGLRVPGAWDPFEIGVRAIVGQQVRVAGANTLMARLVARHGVPVRRPRPGLTHTFPPAATLASADLAGLGLTARRAAAIRGFAGAVADGAVDVAGPASLEALVASVDAVPGLGPWTAQYLALRLGCPDAFPHTDLGLRRALGAGPAVPARELAARAEAWRPWRAYAAIHLWCDAAPGPRRAR